MSRDAKDPEVAAALQAAHSAVDRLRSLDLAPADVDDARALVERVEVLARKVGAVGVRVLQEVQRSGVHRVEGFATAKVLVRHVARLSDAEAKKRDLVARALLDLPVVAASFEAGRIGWCQVWAIARVWSNPRVRSLLTQQDVDAARLAEGLAYLAFSAQLRAWERLVDEDGAAERARAGHEGRDATMHQDFDGNWSGAWNCGGLEGARRKAIFDAFVKAEWDADWSKARAEHGDAATAADLPRTEAQRRSDALDEIFRSGADAHAAAPGGAPILTNLLIDQQTFEDELARLSGQDPQPRDDRLEAPAHTPEPLGYRSSTLDGHHVPPAQVLAAALCGEVRRAVVGAGSVVIDLGRRQRLFTGPAGAALKMQLTTCAWPGCHVPVTHCQGDHLVPWNSGGSTNPGNGAPLCGRHNRTKEQGYRIVRGQLGDLHVHRPDGTEII